MKESKRAFAPLVAVVVILIVIIVGVVVYYETNGGIGIIKPKDVTLTGTVTTTGTGTTPVKITFTSIKTNLDYVAACTGGGNPANYNISLPNGDTYKVFITWKFLGVTGGSPADAGTLNLDTYSSSMMQNWAG